VKFSGILPVDLEIALVQQEGVVHFLSVVVPHCCHTIERHPVLTRHRVLVPDDLPFLLPGEIHHLDTFAVLGAPEDHELPWVFGIIRVVHEEDPPPPPPCQSLEPLG